MVYTREVQEHFNPSLVAGIFMATMCGYIYLITKHSPNTMGYQGDPNPQLDFSRDSASILNIFPPAEKHTPGRAFHAQHSPALVGESLWHWKDPHCNKKITA